MADAARRPRAGAGTTLQPSGFFGFRVPSLPMSVLASWSKGVEAPAAPDHSLDQALARDRARLRHRLEGLVARPDVQSALAVASPDLFEAFTKRSDDVGVEAALVRYTSRMSSRPTPYGLFAAVGVGRISDSTRMELPHPASWRIHSQLDADYLDALVRDRCQKVRDRLSFRPNESLHLMGGRWRYVRSRLDGLERTYHLLQVKDSKHVQRVLEAARDGADHAEVTAAIAAAGVDPQRAARFVDQLIDGQVLVPTLTVTITGRVPLDSLVGDLESVGEESTAGVLRDVREQLAAVDASGASAARSGYERIAAQLDRVGVPIERSRLFHVQMTVPAPETTLARSTVDDVVRGIELLRRVMPSRRPSELDAFRDAFRDRYEGREVPLLEALDEELGVGFGAEPARPDPVPLLEHVRFPASNRIDATHGRREARLLDILHRAWSGGLTEVALTTEDVEALTPEEEPVPWPDAVGATAVLARTSDGPRILVAGASGPSGARLLGRFCHSDPELARHVREHLRAEEGLDPGAIHAEIVHLPSGRLVNVLARPVLREYELEWLGQSGAPRHRVITVDDLLLSLQDDRFVLRSQSLNRRVVPRLTSAHNYNRHSPGIYRFLAAVQSDGRVENVTWTWFPFEPAPFTPRLRRGPVILTLARWRAGGEELKALDQPTAKGRWTAVMDWRGRRHLPRWICLVDDDNVLPFDLHNTLSIDAFVRAVRSREDVLLEELFPGPDELVASAPDGDRPVELVIPLVRAAPVTAVMGQPLQPPSTATGSVRRTFPPGSEWTYLKLYTGSATADALLVDSVGPCVRQLITSGAADRWFLLRYEDPGFHLRVRVHGESDRIRPALEVLAAQAIEEGLAHDAAFGTYTREVERYGGTYGISVAEQVFHADSEAVLDLLGRFDPGSSGLDARWRIGALGADRLLRDLGLDEPVRAVATRRMRSAFEREFQADGTLRRDVAAKIRAERAAIEQLLDASADGDHPLAPGIRVIAERSARLLPVAAELSVLAERGLLTQPVEELAASFVHMWLNRLCRSESRRQEYLTYALLARVYEARSHA